MNAQDLLLGLAVKTLNLTKEAAIELLIDGDDFKSDALSILLTKDKERMAKVVSDIEDPLKDKHKKDRDSQYSRGKKEALSDLEGTLKKYGINVNDDIPEQLEAALSKKKVDAPKDVTMTKEFLDMVAEKEAEKSAAVKAVTNEFESYKADSHKRVVMGNHFGEVTKLIQGLDPLGMPEGSVNALKTEFYGLGVDDQGNRKIMLDAEGKPMLDEHKNPVLLEDWAQQKAPAYFPFPAQSTKQGTSTKAGSMAPVNGSSSAGAKSPEQLRTELRTAKEAGDQAKVESLSKEILSSMDS